MSILTEIRGGYFFGFCLGFYSFTYVYLYMHYVGTATAFVKTQFCLHIGYAHKWKFQTRVSEKPCCYEGFYPQAAN